MVRALVWLSGFAACGAIKLVFVDHSLSGGLLVLASIAAWSLSNIAHPVSRKDEK